ncbi:MAG TPA: hypothetical protein VM240_14080 [Verrucomicrobiae bacterium]|nr:hypothetical protein [Verrucomicrobiae bacterium]
MKIMNFKRKQQGLTAVEYAVLGGVLVVIIAGLAVAFGPALTAAFSNLLS